MSVHKKISSFIIGEGTLASRCADLLLQNGHEVCGIISASEAVKAWAAERGVVHISPVPDLAAFLARRDFDYLFSIVNYRILPKEILDSPRRAAINFHDAPLPRYAGLHATSWALMKREARHGVTWHLMKDQVDAGDILKQRAVEITDDETAFTLNAKCYDAALQSFAELIAELSAGRTTARRQNLAERTYFPANTKPAAGGIISWNLCAEDIDALVRALNFGPYDNPLAAPKLAAGGEFVVVSEVETLGPAMSDTPPGTITNITPAAINISTASREIAIRKLRAIDGAQLSIPDAVAKLKLREGHRLADLDEQQTERIAALAAALSKHEPFWVRQLAVLQPFTLPYAKQQPVDQAATQQHEIISWRVPAEVTTFLKRLDGALSQSDFLAAAYGAYLARLGGLDCFEVGFRDGALGRSVSSMEGLFAAAVPLQLKVTPEKSALDVLRAIGKQLASVKRHKTYARDVAIRYPHLSSLPELRSGYLWPVLIAQVETLAEDTTVYGRELTLVIPTDGADCRLSYDAEVLDESSVVRMLGQFTTFLRSLIAAPEQSLAEIPLLTEEERRRLIVEWNQTAAPLPAGECIHQQFEAQVERTPDAPAVLYQDEQLTYRELNARANQLARYLQGLGVGPETLVGVYMERSLELMVALLGILKAGGAYVPLDPMYPQERISFMLADSGAPVVLTQARLGGNLPASAAHVVCLDSGWEMIARASAQPPARGVTSAHLAYVIYTSGSTGKPKGVMVEHRNVVNFFTGMDERIGGDRSGTWLAVTSISFDISVLELFWTLARGFKVVMHADDDKALAAAEPHREVAGQAMDFSLFYFASDDGEAHGDKYRLLVEGAKFADTHGFAAVWTPERHFHPFGGLYPNPSVTSAFLAGITKRIQLRAGSVVLPLHSPIRVAEEWAVVDNLSGGRVGISFASGWHDRDFVFAPDNYAGRKEVMRREIETVRHLWRGDAITCRGGAGSEVEVKIFPQPVQRKLPIWITAAGGPETFQLAGELGAHVLTHLLFQSTEEIAHKIAVYREAWRKAGHGPGEGRVTIMLHTFVGADVASVREKVRKPFTEYLRSSVDLIKKLTSGTGHELGAKELTEDDHEALLAHAFERYFKTSGLFGTPQTCLEMIEHLKAIGVDEVACLIDFGVDVDSVIASLRLLDELRELSNQESAPSAARGTLHEQITRHGVTHMQCTPSLARMLTLTPAALAALRPLKKLMLGGEALPASLARQLREAVSGEIHNMYGPTETTIWSTTHPLDEIGDTISIGRPIANTEIFILDKHRQPAPVGVAGELLIGGAGVVRGYLHRPELTAEKFIACRFSAAPEGRVYRTGDMARYLPDGNIEFLGRMDSQVKVRGYRIELGEIEAALDEHPAIREAVVAMHEHASGDKRLVAYLTVKQPPTPATAELRAFLKEKLPEHMIPAAFMSLAALPLTPNGKVDRRALPAPELDRPELERNYVAPRNPIEEALAGIWGEVLQLSRVGVDDNFLELGGDSILAVQIVAKANHAGLPISVRNLLDHQTVAELAGVVERTRLPAAVDDAGAGAIPLAPAQQWLLEQELPALHHHNHVALLKTAQMLEPDVLEAATREIIRRHDALRLRFTRTDAGWEQASRADDDWVPFTCVDLSKLTPDDQTAAIETALTELNASLNLTEGPVCRIALFELGAMRASGLALIVHQLAADERSLSILWNDLQAAYRQLSRGEQISLSPGAASFRQWANRGTARANAAPVLREAAYWLAAPRAEVRPLPVEFPRGANTVDTEQNLVTSLTAEETRKLLEDVPGAYHTQTADLLLAALAQAFSSWTGETRLLVDLDSTGREGPAQDIDVMHTVGCFSLPFPALLTLGEAAAPGDILKAIKEQLRSVPHDGSGYGRLRYAQADAALAEQLGNLPQAEIRFSYAEEIGVTRAGLPIFEPVELYTDRHLRQPRRYLLEVCGTLVEDELKIKWTYSEHKHQRSTIQRLANEFMVSLRLFIAHCGARTTNQFTPSDFPLANLNQEKLDKLFLKLAH